MARSTFFWIKTAFTIEPFADRHLADLRGAATEIVSSLQSGAKRERRRDRAQQQPPFCESSCKRRQARGAANG
jgi:hypothetical protein